MLDTFAVTAWRARDVEVAHLLRPKPGGIPLAKLHGRGDVPTLETTARRFDPDGVYSEAEPLDLFRADFPPPSSPVLNGKLLASRGYASCKPPPSLAWKKALAQELAPAPLDGWFEPAVAIRLDAAGLKMLGACWL